MTTKEKIEVMQAYEDGKRIQVRSSSCDEWGDSYYPRWDWGSCEYRINPEPEYRPYNNQDEMLEDFKQKFNVTVPDYEMPLIWLKDKTNQHIHLAINFTNPDTDVMRYFLNCYTYLDGSPLGKLVEE